jgi:hypothetical protein
MPDSAAVLPRLFPILITQIVIARDFQETFWLSKSTKRFSRAVGSLLEPCQKLIKVALLLHYLFCSGKNRQNEQIFDALKQRKSFQTSLNTDNQKALWDVRETA